MPPACNDSVICGQSTYYCEWRLEDGEWQLINAKVPNNYYCPEPPGTGTAGFGGSSQMCLFPCPVNQSSRSARSARSNGSSCQATYKFWNGYFHLVASSSQNGGTCPGDLVKYSQKHSEFGFLVAFEFSTRPYARATYKFKQGKFIVLDGSAENGDWPTDLVAYAKANPKFSFLVTLEFTGKAMKQNAKGRKAPRRGKKSRR